MLDNVLSKFSDKNTYNFLLYFSCLFLFIYLVRSMFYILPLGDDGVIYAWPVGQNMANASKQDFITALFSSFIGEDHLSPIHHIYGYLSYILSSDPQLSLNISTKLTFITIVFSCYILVKEVFKNRLKTLLYVFFVALNIGLSWRHMIYPVSFNIALIATIWSFYFLIKYLREKSNKNLVIFFIAMLIQSFSFETSFIALPLLSSFTFLFLITEGNSPKKFFKYLFLVAITILISHIPYGVIHQEIYGSPLPISRISGGDAVKITYYIRALVLTLSDYLYGLIYYFFNVMKPLLILCTLASVPLIYFICKLRLASKFAIIMFISFLFQLPFILFTGRTEPGMWTLTGLSLWFVIVEIVYNAIKYFQEKSNSMSLEAGVYKTIILTFPLLLILNLVADPLGRADGYYKGNYELTTSAFNAIGGSQKEMTLVRLKGADMLPHPMAFWLGNEIFNKNPGLMLYPKHYQLQFHDMQIEFFHNVEDGSNSRYQKLLKPSKGNNQVVVFQGRNLYQRYYLNIDKNEILSAHKLVGREDKLFNITLPNIDLYKKENAKLEVNIEVEGNTNEVKEIIYNNKSYSDLSKSGNMITFSTVDKTSNIELDLRGQNNIQLKSIAINFFKSLNIDNISVDLSEKGYITLKTSNEPCSYTISSSSGKFKVYGTLSENMERKFKPFLGLESIGDLEINYRTFYLQDKGKSVTIKHSQSDTNVYALCPSRIL